MFNKKTINSLDDPEHGYIFTRAIIDTIQEPLIVLNENLQILAASKSFFEKFNLDIENTQGKMFYELNEGDWNIPDLRRLLEQVIPQNKIVENYEINHNFFGLGQRVMLINAREIRYENDQRKMLLVISDVTRQRKLEKENEQLIKQKDILLKEMRHRIANSLQLIASILLLKAGTVESEEVRLHLEDAHERIMSIATVQGQLDPIGLGGEIKINPYLNALCESLTKSMIGERKPISIKVNTGLGALMPDEAISIGLITTELVMNSIKYAFPSGEGKIMVSYEKNGDNWKLVVEDNGVGMSQD